MQRDTTQAGGQPDRRPPRKARRGNGRASGVGLLEFPIRRYQFTLVAFLCLVALGWYAFVSVPREEDPYFKIPGFTIAAIYPGADPKDLERLIAKPIEDRFADARRRAQDRNLDPRRRVVHGHRVPGVHRRRQEVRRGDARGECAAAGVPAEIADHRAQDFQPGAGQHRADRAGVRGRSLPRARGLRARAQGPAQDRRRRAHLGKLGLSRARAAHRRGPQAHVGAQSRAGAGDRRGAERKRQHPRGFRRSRRAQFFSSRPPAATPPSTRCATPWSPRSTGASCAFATWPR